VESGREEFSRNPRRWRHSPARRRSTGAYCAWRRYALDLGHRVCRARLRSGVRHPEGARSPRPQYQEDPAIRGAAETSVLRIAHQQSGRRRRPRALLRQGQLGRLAAWRRGTGSATLPRAPGSKRWDQPGHSDGRDVHIQGPRLARFSVPSAQPCSVRYAGRAGCTGSLRWGYEGMAALESLDRSKYSISVEFVRWSARVVSAVWR
jgi:hypothetical protein